MNVFETIVTDLEKPVCKVISSAIIVLFMGVYPLSEIKYSTAKSNIKEKDIPKSP